MASSVSDSVAGDSAAAFSSYTFLKNEKRVHRRLPFGPTSLYSEPVTGSMIIGWSTSLSDPKVRPRRPRSPRASRRQRNLAPAALAESRQRATSGRRARARRKACILHVHSILSLPSRMTQAATQRICLAPAPNAVRPTRRCNRFLFGSAVPFCFRRTVLLLPFHLVAAIFFPPLHPPLHPPLLSAIVSAISDNPSPWLALPD